MTISSATPIQTDRSSLLRCEKLGVFTQRSQAREWLIRDISLSVGNGEIVAVIGESGSGKTTFLRALTNLFPVDSLSGGSALVREGTVVFRSEPIDPRDSIAMRNLRVEGIRYIFQEPGSVLNPVHTIGSQFRAVGISTGEAVAMLTDMQLSDPEQLLKLYPHQVSIGMLQRITMAMALHGSPSLILADEPTSAVDAELREHIMRMLVDRCRRSEASLIVATHDLGVVRSYADTVVVLLGGLVVERAPAEDFFTKPYHPYSQALVESSQATTLPHVLRFSGVESGREATWHTACGYANVCPLVREQCHAIEPPIDHASDSRDVRCLYWK